ncbi:MAG TPA: steroid 3-ketoacyl-CoA thiolase [Acidimicrobiia bacterium]|nr:steroid 3-ketoacyl-CoA thiolase [Acidimicrobiia bacterium]
MRDVVVVEAVRSPVGRRKGGLSGVHAADLLGAVQRAVIDRSGIDPAEVGQVVGGCVGQVGMQAANVTRTAWLQAGLPLEAAATTVHTQCGSSQQATNIATALIAAGVVDVAVACGVEVMSVVSMGASVPKDPFVGKPITRKYWEHYENTSQFEGAERIAEKFELTREELDAFGKQSQDRAAVAWAEGRFDTQIVPIEAPTLDEQGEPAGTHTVTRDEGLRDTSIEALANLKPVLDREPAFHTAGTASQISDGAGALLLMTAEKADALGLVPRARIVDTCIVGSDPVLMLTGPIPATEHLLERNKLSIDDLDLVEINEAFASVVLGWQRTTGADMARVNPNGGAIALGHPLGGTGSILVTKAVHELERSGGRRALVTMCCGGGLGTGTILERV